MNATPSRAETPWFTDRDQLLSMVGSVRDPMGRQGVWRSGIGRALVPRLASGVTRLDGIIALLFIYHVVRRARQAGKGWSVSATFRLLEGCLECYLQLRDGPVYGIQALGDPASFTIRPKDGRIACNGLSQYYRGTCRRAGLITQDLLDLEEETHAWCVEAIEGQERTIVGLLESVGDVLESNASVRPLDAFLSKPPTLDLLDQFFRHSFWAPRLKEPLLGSHTHELRFAELCADIHLASPNLKASLDSIMQATSDRNETDVSIRSVVPHIERCERFICWTVWLFGWLQHCDRMRIDKATVQLEVVKDELASAALSFLVIPPDLQGTDRFRALAGVAGTIVNDFPSTVRSLVEYHSRVMAPRGLEPLMLIEAGALVVRQPEYGPYDLGQITSDVESGEWLDDYYMVAAGQIFRQIREHDK